MEFEVHLTCSMRFPIGEFRVLANTVRTCFIWIIEQLYYFLFYLLNYIRKETVYL